MSVSPNASCGYFSLLLNLLSSFGWNPALYCIVVCIVLHCIVLYGIVLYCIVLYCIVLYCIVLYCVALRCVALRCVALRCVALRCVALRCVALRCVALHCTVLYCTVLYCTVLYCTVLYCIVLYCIVLYCIVLYCIVLYCIVLYFMPMSPDASCSYCSLLPSLLSSFGWNPASHCILLLFGLYYIVLCHIVLCVRVPRRVVRLLQPAAQPAEQLWLEPRSPGLRLVR